MQLQHTQLKTNAKLLQRSLLRWYKKHSRALPWRDEPTPYRVWISEIMLQQTQVKTVIPYYNRFLERFPNVETLAKAREEDVLALWAGLGYYSRARNLHKSAALIVHRYGHFPADFDTILALPGIGRYTAGAICSIAFNQPKPVVDGNIRRVISRLHALRKHPPSGYFWNQMTEWIPAKEPSAFNQAMMELGATICLPLQPRWCDCPLESLCQGQRLGIQNDIPSARAQQPIRHVSIVMLILAWKEKILLTSEHKLSFIPGEWGLPCRQIATGESPESAAFKFGSMIAGRRLSLFQAAEIRHSISNYRIRAFAFCGKLDRLHRPPPTDEAIWVSRKKEGML